MCSEVGAFLAKLERVQQGWSMYIENCTDNGVLLRFYTYQKLYLERVH